MCDFYRWKRIHLMHFSCCRKNGCIDVQQVIELVNEVCEEVKTLCVCARVGVCLCVLELSAITTVTELLFALTQIYMRGTRQDVFYIYLI